ncbi:MAG: uroporphyrinogen-III synthase, partial [bacterium]
MTTTQAGGLAGLKVVSFESRMTTEMANLIRGQGGQPLIVPSVREVPPASNAEALAFGEGLLAGKVDVLILLTGGGTRALVALLETRHPRERIVAALGRVTLVCRGPKIVHALAQLGLKPAVVAPEPNTWRDMLGSLDDRGPVRGKQVAVQEYGTANEALYDGLAERGALVTRVPVYRWALPEDPAVLRAAVRDVAEGRDDVVLFTSAVQVEHVMKVAQQERRGRALRLALARIVVGSVGPTTSEALREFGLAVDVEPEHPSMGHLVLAAAAQAPDILRKKRRADEIRVTARAPVAAGTRDGPLHDSLFMKACRREPTAVTPVWLMRQAGRYMKEYRVMREDVGFLELCRDPAR